MQRLSLEREFQRLDKIEKDIYSEIGRRQGDVLRELEEQQKKRKKEMARQSQIKRKSHQEIIKHPQNGHIWVNLANFINHEQQIDLQSIATRQAERKQFREQLAKKDKTQNGNQIESEETEIKTREKGVAPKQKVNWKLMRELRRKEVEENKKRIERMQENKREKMQYYHRY